MNEIIKLGSLFIPYFKIERSNLKRIIAALVIILSGTAFAFSMVYLQNAISALNLILLDPQVTVAGISDGVLACLTPILALGGFFSIGTAASSWLSGDLYHVLSHSLIKKWTDSDAYYGSKFINAYGEKGEKINPSTVLSSDLETITESSIGLTDSFVRSGLNFLVGIHQLCYLSAPWIINLFSRTFVIPAPMVVAALFYAVAYSLLITFLDKNLRAVDHQLRQNRDNFTGHLHHVSEHSESIALKKGGPKEQTALLRSLNEVSVIKYSRLKIFSAVSFVQSIGSNVAFLFGLILTASGIIAGKTKANDAFSISSYFTSIVSFFTWKKDNTAMIVDLNVSVERFEKFRNLMQEWEKVRAGKTLKKINGKSLGVDITLLTPSDEPMLTDVKFKIPNGEATVIQGPSGIGKTTIFLRTLAGLWPYVKGEIFVPVDGKGEELKIYFIPQKPFFAYRGTLLETINYPRETSFSDSDKLKIKKLMADMGFKEKTIQDLDKRLDWSDVLSGGEQQRIAVIAAIMSNPDILIMDEGTNGLDRETKYVVEKTLKEKLSKATIIAIDHNVGSRKEDIPFFDKRLILSEKDKKATVSLEEYVKECPDPNLVMHKNRKRA